VPPSITILAPADGFVLSRHVSIGQKFSRGAELYRLADLRRVWILSNVSGVEGKQIRPGAIARVTARGSSAAVRARVSTDVLPQFDEVTQATQLRLEADNPGYVLRPGMFVDVDLPVTLPPAIAVPAEAILDSGFEKTVFVESGDGIFEARRVRTGWRLRDRVQIVEGLDVGERIVVSGAFLLDSETHLQRPQPAPGSSR
jgi:membrane fusion protein, copper/silver efflux system